MNVTIEASKKVLQQDVTMNIIASLKIDCFEFDSFFSPGAFLSLATTSFVQ